MKNFTTAGEALAFGKGFLKSRRIKSFSVDAEVLFMHLTGFSKTRIFADTGTEITDSLYAKYSKLLKMRAKFMPVAYITNECEFYSLPFYVDSRTLIPRPDTETLVENVLKVITDDRTAFAKQLEILEIGTGSGCISVAIAKNYHGAKITACDISRDALEVAEKNATNNGVASKITFLQSDLLKNINGKFDIIVSNPPYIPSKDIAGLDADVRNYEPISALDGGSDGLDFFKKITAAAPSFLKKGGLLFFEIGYNQAEDVKKIMIQHGFNEDSLSVVKDYSGRNRVIFGRL